MTSTATTAEQYEQVHQAIVEVAVRCDGAQSLDGQGFSGVDTKFGRRIAAVPFDQWTEDVCQEAAHIILKYRQQVLAWTDGRIDVGKLPIVIEAQGWSTNYAGRNQARTYEKAAQAKANRKVDAADGQLFVTWARDPEFDALLTAVKGIPGRRWDRARKVNQVRASEELDAFIDSFDFTVTDAARALLEAPRKAPEPVYHITLDPQARRKVVIDTPYNPAIVDAVRSLPGRAWDAANKVNRADAHPAVLSFAERFGLNVHPDAVAAIEDAQAALNAKAADDLVAADIATVMSVVSSTGKPEDLPAVFLDMLQGVLSHG